MAAKTFKAQLRSNRQSQDSYPHFLPNFPLLNHLTMLHYSFKYPTRFLSPTEKGPQAHQGLQVLSHDLPWWDSPQPLEHFKKQEKKPKQQTEGLVPKSGPLGVGMRRWKEFMRTFSKLCLLGNFSPTKRSNATNHRTGRAPRYRLVS